MNPELKGMIEDLTNKFIKLLNLNSINDLVLDSVRKHYNIGLEEAEVKFDMNFMESPERIRMLETYTFENIKGMNDDMAERLRQEIQRGVMNLESVNKVQERVEKVMDIGRDRARMIARTEMNRAENMGHIDAARQSGLKLMKQWDAHLDTRTSSVCRDLDGVKIPLDAKFRWKGQEFDTPPAHPNCRSVLIFIQEDDDEETKSMGNVKVETKVPSIEEKLIYMQEVLGFTIKETKK